MADDDDSNDDELNVPAAFIWQGDGDMPEPIKQMLARASEQQQRNEMAAADRYHNEMRFYEDAPLDFLRAHLSVLITSDSGDNSGLAFSIGYVQAVIKLRFNVCPVHGVDHDQEMLESLAPDAEE